MTAGFQGIYVWNKAVRDNGRKFHCYLWLMLQFKTIYLCICGKVPQNFSTNIHVDGKITKCFFSFCHSGPTDIPMRIEELGGGLSTLMIILKFCVRLCKGAKPNG